MKHYWDSKRGIFRTEYPRARLADYILMFVLAFSVGSIVGGIWAFRMHAESRPSYGAEHVPATPENRRAVYQQIATTTLLCGVGASVVWGVLLWKSIRQIREREERMARERYIPPVVRGISHFESDTRGGQREE